MYLRTSEGVGTAERDYFRLCRNNELSIVERDQVLKVSQSKRAHPAPTGTALLVVSAGKLPARTRVQA